MPAKTKAKTRPKMRRVAVDADVVAQIDRLVKAGKYASRVAVLEAAFAALEGEASPPRKTRAELEREAREIFPGNRPKVNFTAALSALKTR